LAGARGLRPGACRGITVAMSHPDKTVAIFGREKALVGMVHVGALPGTPYAIAPVDVLVRQAVDEARLLTTAGFDALIVENMHDRPFLRGRVGPEVIAAMTAIATAVRGAVDVPLGVQVLAAANREALAVALASGASFVRVENFAFAHVADEGLMPEAEAGPLLRYRKAIGAESIAILADVKKKHASHAITADVDIADAARAAEFFGADGVIVTGVATAQPVVLEAVAAVATAVSVPVVIGSGVTPDNLPALWPHAGAFIVGSYFKRDGDWRNAPDPARVKAMADAAEALRT
jgi:membrane complex biogenesis BtpA family protein